LLILLSVSGCAKPQLGSSFCAIYEPVKMTDVEWSQLSEQSETMILRNQATYLALCH
jgi:hypothetical protein